MILPAHFRCDAPGKYDCDADEYVHSAADDEGSGEGDVSSPVAWFAEVTLDLDSETKLIEHYGTRYLIARTLESGVSPVEMYDTQQARDERLEELRAAYAEWDTGALS